MSSRTLVRDAEKKERRAARKATDNPLIEGLARGGYMARGLVYALVGLLAMQLAFADGGTVTDQNGAIAYLGAQPFGKGLLILLAIGLIGYSLWGFLRALLDPLKRGHDVKGLAARFGYLVSAVSYGALVFVALYYSTGLGTPGAGKPQDLSAQLLTKPYGPWLVGIFGLFWIGSAAAQFWFAWKADFMRDLKPDLDERERAFAAALGRIGYAARGIVFGLIGWFLIQAAMTVDPTQAVGLDGALWKLAQQPSGMWLLGAVAFGLLLFGIFSILCARWIRVFRPGKAN